MEMGRIKPGKRTIFFNGNIANSSGNASFFIFSSISSVATIGIISAPSKSPFNINLSKFPISIFLS